MKVYLFLFLGFVMSQSTNSQDDLDPETNLYTPTSWDNFYVKLYDNPIILVGFFDSKQSSDSADNTVKTLAYLRSTEYMERKEIPVMSVDMSVIPKVKSFYEFDQDTHLWLFVRNRAYKMENFNQVLSKGYNDSNLEDVYDWVKKTVDGLIVETDSADQLSNELKKHGVITVYLGDKNNNFDKFKSWVLQYSKDHLYCMFDKNQRNAFLKKWDKQSLNKLSSAEDLIAVVWDDSKLNEFDSVNFTMMKDFDDEKDLNIFYLFETQPKIRKESSTSDNVFLMYQRHLPLFLYNYEEGPQSHKHLQELNQALKVLPKRFVYDVFEHNSRRAIDYQHIMIQSTGYKLMEPNSLYIVWLTHGTKPQIMKFEKKFEMNEIINWTFEFSEMFPRLFGNVKKEITSDNRLEEDL